MLTSPPPGNDRVLGVASLNRLVRDCLETTFPLMWVGGEISNLTYAASGHLYFSLKDANAQVRCVMWRSRAQLLARRLENGQKIEARALVSFYEPRGEFQLNVETLRTAGQGDLFERFLRLKAQLEAEGLFAPEHKLPLPVFPRRLAIVTSLQAAALRDVLSTLRRRAPHIVLTLYPTLVQGEGAGRNIAAAIEEASAGKQDLILLCRGGGSIEDLWAFNEEIVARAIHASRLPVVTGIGHETDFTIADFVADLRAPTPTAAAELVSPDGAAWLTRLEEWRYRLTRASERGLDNRQQQLDWLSTRLLHPAERLRQRTNETHQLGERLSRALSRQHEISTVRLQGMSQRLTRAAPDTPHAQTELNRLALRLADAKRRLQSTQSMKLIALERSLRQLDPLAVLARGYAIATDSNGRAVLDAANLHSGSVVQLTFARGAANATVNEVVASSEAQ